MINIKLSYKGKVNQCTGRLHRFGKRCAKGQCKWFVDYAKNKEHKGRDAQTRGFNFSSGLGSRMAGRTGNSGVAGEVLLQRIRHIL